MRPTRRRRPTIRSRRPRPSSADALGTQAVLVTRSEAGMTLVGEGAPMHVPAYPVRVRDVSGAGDTVVAVLAAMLAMRADFESAMRAANAAAAVVVGKRGTATLVRGGIALAHPAGGDARARGENRVRLGVARRASRANGGGRACASASPMAASICCIPATSNCWPARARPATAWWSA